MKNTLLFSLFASEALAQKIQSKSGMMRGEIFLKRFPDEESYLRFSTSPEKMKVVILTDFSRPDAKLWPLLLAAATARDLGAVSVLLIAPYLPYMRQDIRFQEGEAISSKYFAELLSRYFDALITIDPHLHRYLDLSEIYSIKTSVGHAAPVMAEWIRANIAKPLLIGPDSESKQWVSEVAQGAAAPYVVLQKIRKGDREVEVSIPQIAEWQDSTPVVLDDMISTAQTMIQTVQHLKKMMPHPPVCMGVHPIFAGHAYEELMASGAGQVISCNTIEHPSNRIDLSGVLLEQLLSLL